MTRIQTILQFVVLALLASPFVVILGTLYYIPKLNGGVNQFMAVSIGAMVAIIILVGTARWIDEQYVQVQP